MKHYRKIGFVFLFLFQLVACSTSQNTAGETKDDATDDVPEFPYDRTLCFPLSYEADNISNDEDIILLVEEQHDLLKDFFDNDVIGQLSYYGFKLTDENCNYTLQVKELLFKEFKIQVEGPEINVATVHVDYIFKTPQKDTLLFDEINRESASEFEGNVFQDMCSELSTKVLKKITRIADAETPQ